MKWEYVTIVALLMLLGALLFDRAWHWMGNLLVRALESMRAPLEGGMLEQPPVREIEISDGWAPIGGDRLELRDSGFFILLQPTNPHAPYWLFNPESVLCGCNADLAMVKRYGERLAEERATFSLGTPGRHVDVAAAIARMRRS
jgi:hypothetical protein